MDKEKNLESSSLESNFSIKKMNPLAIEEQFEINTMIKEFDNLDELKEHKGMGIIYWCGSMRCAEEIEIKTEKKILGYPVGERHAEGKCIVCGKNTSNKIYVAKTY